MRTLFLALLGLLLVPATRAQNDDCSNATVVSTGTFAFNTSTATSNPPIWTCAGAGGPDLWYRFDATNAGSLNVSLCGSAYDTALEVYTGTCSVLVLVGCVDDSCGFQSELNVTLTPGVSYYIRIGGYNGAVGAGSMTLTFVPVLGPEDECPGALPLASGSTLFTNVNSSTSLPTWPCGAAGSDIWFRFSAAGANIDVDTFGSGFDTVIEVFEGGCGSLVSLGCNDDSGGFQSYLSIPTVAGRTYHLRVGGYFGANGNGRVNLVGAGGPPGSTIGTNYCMASPNSTGQTGRMSGSGSASVANNNLTLGAERLPLNSFGYFLTGTIQASTPVPNANQSILCIGGPIGRYTGPGQLRNSGSSGTFSLQIDLARTPTPTGIVVVVAGQTRNFQAWHRDAVNGTAVSNFTDGMSVTFL